MIKRAFIFAFLVSIFLVAGVYAAAGATCSLSANLINQDPYPATPNDYVKVVFQLDGIKNPDCGNVVFQIVPQYPFSLESGQTDKISVSSGTYTSSNYQSFLLAQYKLRVDKDAVDGENPVSVRIIRNVGESGIEVAETKDFNVTIQDSRTDFEVSIQDYVSTATTNTLTLGVVNIGKKNAEAVTVEIPQQNGIVIKGTNIGIIGSLNANDDTTVSFIGATPQEGKIKVNIAYNDNLGNRRTLEKEVSFTRGYIEKNAVANGTKSSDYYLLITSWILFIIVGVILYMRRRKRIAKEKLMKRKLG